LKRQIFTTRRELEYFSESELATQTSHAKSPWWPKVIAKELMDNSLDAMEFERASTKRVMTHRMWWK
jgi:hypothetical protein